MPSASSFLDESESASSFLDESDYEEVSPPQRPVTGASGTWEDESGLPPEITNPAQRQQLEQASMRLEGDRLSAEQERIPDLSYLTEVPSAEHISQFLKEQRDFDKAIHGQGTIVRPTMTPLEQGVDQAKEEFIMGQATPVGVGTMAATLGLGGTTPILSAAGRVAGGVFGYEGTKGTIEGVQRFQEAETPQEQVAALASIPVSAGTAIGGLAGAFHRTSGPVRPQELPNLPVREIADGTAKGLSKTVAAVTESIAKDVVANEVEAAKVEEAPAQEVVVENPAPEAAPLTPSPGERLVTIEKPDGTTEQASFGDKYWDMGEVGGKLPSVARWTGGGWSHGLLREGERIVESAKPVEQPATQPAKVAGNTQNVITKGTIPERVVVQAEQVLENGETVPGYVTIQSKGNAQSGPIEVWRAAGHEIPDASKLPSGTYTVEELRKLTKEKGAQNAKEEITQEKDNALLESTPLDPQGGSPILPNETKTKSNLETGQAPNQLRAPPRSGEGVPAEVPGGVSSTAKTESGEIGSKSVVGPPSKPPSPPAPPTTGAPESPAGQKMRKSAARATESPDIPAPVQETIKTAPESFYDPQSMKRVEEVVSAMPEEALSGVPPTSDLYVASKLEQARRRFDAGDNDAGYNVFVELEKQGTSFGRNINQFKRLAGALPEHVAFVIDKKLKAAGKDPLTENQRGRVIEITKRNKQADAALDKATQAWKDNPTTGNAKAAETKLDAANESALELQQFTNKFQPRTVWGTLKSILQGNLLTPISEAYNLFGNMSFAPFRALTRGGGASIDIIDSFIRNKSREVAVQPIRGTIEAAKGAVRGIKEIPAILAKGTGNAIKGETRSGLHPLRAWADQFAMNPERPTVGGKLGFQERLNLALEGTFGLPAEVMLRGLGAGDAPFRRAAEARVVTEQLKLKGVPREQWAFAQKFPELFFDRSTMEQVRNDSAAAIFQGKSTSLDAINRLIRNNWATQRGVHPDAMDFAFSIVAPYKLTPWKITGEILSYNPLVAMARTALEAKNGNTRAAKLNASKLVVGSVLTAGSYWLYQKGLLAPSLDDRDETQKSRILAGEVLPPNHVNVSGLKRALEGGDPAFKKGDETVDIFRAGGLAGANMYLVANIGRDFERKPEEAQGGLVGSIIRQSTLESAKFAMNQSYLSGVEGFLTAIKDGNSDSYVRQLINTVGSIPLPNTLGAISRATREYKPDFSADTFNKQVESMVRSRLGFAGLDDYLPLKRGLWGEPLLETPKDRNALFYHFFDISKNKQVTDDPVALELYHLWRKTGNGRVIPEPVDKAITIQRQTYPLTPALQSRYAELVGTERKAITEMLVTNPEFHDYEDEAKMKLLERAYQKGLERGKLAFWDENGENLKPKPSRAGFTP